MPGAVLLRPATATERKTAPLSVAFSVLTICGIEELPDHCTRGVTHVL
jgi:hypothetical protein